MRLEPALERDLFQRSGLIHLIVVSGGHLQILALLLLAPTPKAWRQRWWCRSLLWVALILYALSTGFQAPVVRALIGRAFGSISRRCHWHWDQGKCQISAGLVALALFPEWIHSLSFYLSWLASIGFLMTPLCWTPSKKKRLISRWLLTSGLIQSFMTLIFGSFSWIAVVSNAFVAPVLGVLLAPLSLLPVFFSTATPLVDGVWASLLRGMDLLLTWTAPPSAVDFAHLRWGFLWVSLAILQAFCQWAFTFRYQRSHV